MQKFTIVAEYNGKEYMRVTVTGIDASDALSNARVVLGKRYALRVIT